MVNKLPQTVTSAARVKILTGLVPLLLTDHGVVVGAAFRCHCDTSVEARRRHRRISAARSRDNVTYRTIAAAAAATKHTSASVIDGSCRSLIDKITVSSRSRARSVASRFRRLVVSPRDFEVSAASDIDGASPSNSRGVRLHATPQRYSAICASTVGRMNVRPLDVDDASFPRPDQLVSLSSSIDH